MRVVHGFLTVIAPCHPYHAQHYSTAAGVPAGISTPLQRQTLLNCILTDGTCKLNACIPLGKFYLSGGYLLHKNILMPLNFSCLKEREQSKCYASQRAQHGTAWCRSRCWDWCRHWCRGWCNHWRNLDRWT